MKFSTCFSGVIAVFLLTKISLTMGQSNLSPMNNIYQSLYYEPNRSIIVDPDTLDYNGYLSFLNTILQSDQKYRKILKQLEGSTDTTKIRFVEKSMYRNDKENQVVLLSLLKKFGWPCSEDKNYSFFAWLVVWHADYTDKAPFYPYLREGHSRGCIVKGHYEKLGLK